MLENNKCEHGLTHKSSPAARFRNGLMYFIAGTGIGATVALLFAPKSGSELRGDIADATRNGYDATLEKANDLKERSADVIQTVKDKAEAVYNFASGKLAFGSDAVSDVVSSPTGAVSDAIERLQNESGMLPETRTTGRKSSSIV
jgi:gas vesicle protein